MKPFGYSYLLDMYACKAGSANDLELCYRFLEQLVDRLGMTRMSQPVVIHAPTDHGKELFPDKAGVSGWVPLIESGIQIHAIEPTHFIALDVFSCKEFNKEDVFKVTLLTFDFKMYEHRFLERGMKYNAADQS